MLWGHAEQGRAGAAVGPPPRGGGGPGGRLGRRPRRPRRPPRPSPPPARPGRSPPRPGGRAGLRSEELLRAAVDLVGHLARPGGAWWCSRTSSGPTPKAWPSSPASPSPPAFPSCWSAPTGRRTSTDRRLADVVSDLERRRSVERIELAPLGRDEVGDLLAAATGRAVPLPGVEAIHRRTGGNPFFVEELLLAAGEADPATLARLPLPASLTEAVVGHLDGLGAEERRAVDAAAVLGHTIPFDILASAHRSGRGRPHRGAPGAGGTRASSSRPAPDVFAFRHDLTREAVTSRLLGRERRRLHERALEAMQAAGSDDWSALAHHAAAAGRFDDLVAIARTGAGGLPPGRRHAPGAGAGRAGLEEAGGDLDLLELAARAAWAVGSTAQRHRPGRAMAAPGCGVRRRPVPRRRPAPPDPAAVRGGRSGRSRAGSPAEALEVAERLGPSEELAAAYNLMAETTMLALPPARKRSTGPAGPWPWPTRPAPAHLRPGHPGQRGLGHRRPARSLGGGRRPPGGARPPPRSPRATWCQPCGASTTS